jgi:hypothetical protein
MVTNVTVQAKIPEQKTRDQVKPKPEAKPKETTTQAKQSTTQVKQSEPLISLTPLANKLGLTPKRLRSLLRANYPRPNKGQPWEITQAMAKKIEKDYRDKVKAKEEAKNAEAILERKGTVNKAESLAENNDTKNSIDGQKPEMERSK